MNRGGRLAALTVEDGAERSAGELAGDEDVEQPDQAGASDRRVAEKSAVSALATFVTRRWLRRA